MTAHSPKCPPGRCGLCDFTPAPGCSICGGPTSTVSLYTGRRCDRHRPTFDRRVLAALYRAGWTSAARAYINTFTMGAHR